MSPTPLPIGLQLYTVRTETARDFAGTIRAVARMGYDGVEFAGYGGIPAAAMRELLDETGLRVAGTHVSVERLREGFDEEIEYCRATRSEYLVLPSLPEDKRGAESLAGAVALLNELGERCHRSGVSFAYHNHDSEFVHAGGRPLWERLVEETDHRCVAFELDVFWAARAGADPRDLLRRYADRIPVVHLKDLGAGGEQLDVGDGSLELASLYAELGDSTSGDSPQPPASGVGAAPQPASGVGVIPQPVSGVGVVLHRPGGCPGNEDCALKGYDTETGADPLVGGASRRWAIVEHDDPARPLESARRSLRNLRPDAKEPAH
jgi:sugar phosphate isomerase/epimerase